MRIIDPPKREETCARCVLRGKKNFARPREKRKKHTFLREKKRFSVKEKCRATKKEKVIVALHPSERIVDFDDDDDEDFFSSFPQKFIPHHNKRAFKKREKEKEQIKRTQVRVRVIAAVRELLVVLVQVGR